MVVQERLITIGTGGGESNGLLFDPGGVPGSRAVLFAHKWGGYHFDTTPRFLGRALAERGIPVLSIGLRDHGMEGRLHTTPDIDNDTINNAMATLSAFGFTEVVLAGEGIGALTMGYYQATTGDSRVLGLVCVRPGHQMGAALEKSLGSERYGQLVEDAESAVRNGRGWSHIIDAPRQNSLNAIVMFAESWQAWWGPNSVTDLSRYLPAVKEPVFVVGSDTAWENALKNASTASRDVRTDPTRDNPGTADLIMSWMASVLPPTAGRPTTETVEVTAADGTSLLGFISGPASGASTLLIWVHDLDDNPGGTLPVRMGPALARAGIGIVSIQLRRSGLAGLLSSTPEMDAEDINAFIQILAARGYDRIVLAGNGFGCLGAALAEQDQGAALVLIDPSADGPEWVKSALGDRYQSSIDAAQRAITKGETSLIDETVATEAGPIRLVHRPDSWLAWWGPDSSNRLSTAVGQSTKPVLILGGNDATRDALLAAAQVPSSAVKPRQPGANEAAIATEIAPWLATIG